MRMRRENRIVTTMDSLSMGAAREASMSWREAFWLCVIVGQLFIFQLIFNLCHCVVNKL